MLIAATSVVVLTTAVMPRWMALAGFVAALFALLRFLIPMGGILGLLWVLAVSALCSRAERSKVRLALRVRALPPNVSQGWPAITNTSGGVYW